jgi:glycosyltransferase involved in cell wall biosynthesis
MATGEPKTLLGLTLKVLRNEGLEAVRNRSRDRAEEKRRLRQLQPLSVVHGGLSIDAPPAPVLNVSPTPPSPKRGGSQIQMLDRLAVEKDRRTVALVYPNDGIWWLEIWAGSSGGILSLGETSTVAECISRAAVLSGTDLVHIENISGLPLTLIRDLTDNGRETMLTVHDFTLFCRKPHLIEATTGEFCGYCVDDERCSACLRDIDPENRYPQTEYRRAGDEALTSAAVVIYPSDFLRRVHHELFPTLQNKEAQTVIPPATARPETTVDRAAGAPRVGFIGGAYVHKGAALIPGTMDLVRDSSPDALGFVYGNGDSQSFELLKSVQNLKVRGYYRQGELARLLARDKISVAVLTSIWPEAYGLVVDECLAAGAPVVAFDLGAVADRLGSWGVGRLALPDLGAHGLAQAIVDLREHRAEIPRSVIEALPRPESAAHEHLALYRILQSRKEETTES